MSKERIEDYLLEIIDDLKNYLDYCKNLKFKGFPIKDEDKFKEESKVVKLEDWKKKVNVNKEVSIINEIDKGSLTVKEALIKDIKSEVSTCKRCNLYSTRRNFVVGKGDLNANLMFIGEAPGYEEDLKGEPFVGAAGDLLTRIIKAIGLTRESVYITNLIKCRPPKNRDPYPEEIDVCKTFLIKEINIIKPNIICTLGKYSSQTLLNLNTPIKGLRGNIYKYNGIPVIPTFHPAYLLRYPEDKRLVWQDMQLILNELRKLK